MILLFAYRRYYPTGGGDDLVVVSGSLDGALRDFHAWLLDDEGLGADNENFWNVDFAHAYDVERGRVVARWVKDDCEHPDEVVEDRLPAFDDSRWYRVETDEAFRFQGDLIIENVPTTDGRFIPKDATTWRASPLPLFWMRPLDDKPYNDSVQVGEIQSIWRAGNVIMCSGTINTDAPPDLLDAINEGQIRLEADGDGRCQPPRAGTKLTFANYEIYGATLGTQPCWPDARFVMEAPRP